MRCQAATRSEIRDSQTGIPLGEWFAPNSMSGYSASQNCWTDSAWFFPTLGSLAGGPNVVLSYVGQETRNGTAVQHIQSYQYVSGDFPVPTPQQLSTMDFYLDATTLLPSAVIFNAHPDNDALTNIITEIDWSGYQSVNGIQIPSHIQRYVNGQLLLDLSITSSAFNSGLSLSDFAIQ